MTLAPMPKSTSARKKKFNQVSLWQGLSAGLLITVIFLSFFSVSIEIKLKSSTARAIGQELTSVTPEQDAGEDSSDISKVVLPAEGVTIPIKWGNLGAQMIATGVIDALKFESIYAQRGGLSDDEKNLLYGTAEVPFKLDAQNSATLLNLLWAFGLANKSEILATGPMQDPRYGGADRFASTGGWTLAKGEAMDHYSKHEFVVLSQEQAEMVKRVSENIYRPCCGNSTYFPDCNHGMAMLGLLQLMAAQNLSEAEMYQFALKVNSYWFPDTYLAIATYFAKQGVQWKDVDAKEALGSAYSSAAGYRKILTEVEPPKSGGSGGGCGV